MTDLATSIEGILGAIVSALEAASVIDGPLDGIKTVVRGERARPQPAMPAVWVVPEQASFRQESYGTETWALPVILAALVKGTNPDTTAQLSQVFAAKARGVALAARPTSETGIAVTDVISQTFDPQAHSSESNRSLFWTEATILVTFDCDS